MGEAPGGDSFPVVFFDGVREISMNEVEISESMEFKKFQSCLSSRIGISPNQFSVYLADCKKTSDSSSPKIIHRRIPITGKVNFGALIGKKDCFFLVVLKRSGRGRRRKSLDNVGSRYYHWPAVKSDRPDKNPPENMRLLRRNHEIDNQIFPEFISPVVDRFGYNQMIRNLQFERERYLLNMGLSGRSIGRAVVDNSSLVCRDCSGAKETAEFHCCVYDRVIKGFRSSAGPIARPSKNSD